MNNPEKNMGKLLCMLTVVLLAVLLASNDTWSQTDPKPKPKQNEATFFPVIVNIYQSSNVSKIDANRYIQDANKILNQAKIKLCIVWWNVPTPAGGPLGDDGDAEITPWEQTALLKYGTSELGTLMLPPEGKGFPGAISGIKVSFVKEPFKDAIPPVPGEGPINRQTIILKKLEPQLPPAGKITKTGEEVAHLVCRVLGLGPKHEIHGKWKADDLGFAPTEPVGDEEKYGRKNLMAVSNIEGGPWRNGYHLSPEQIKTLEAARNKYGLTIRQMEKLKPAVKEEHERAGAADKGRIFKGPDPMYDLGKVFLNSSRNLDLIDATITVIGVFPDTIDFNATYSLAFNSDSLDALGDTTYAGYDGIDHIVFINLSSVMGSFSTESVLRDIVHDVTHPLPESTVVVKDYLYYDDGDSLPKAMSTSFMFEIPKTMLDLSTLMVPVVATAGSSAVICDTLAFFFDREWWLHTPTLEPFGTDNTGVPTPGADYPFAVYGLKPGSPYDVYVDTILVFSDILDQYGSTDTSFIFPAGLSVDTMSYIISVQDTTGWCACCITSFGDSTIMLPLKLLSFAAFAGDGYVTLTWETASEIDVHSFKIRRDSEAIASVEAFGDAHQYRYVDRSVTNGVTYTYQLSDVGLDGTETVYDIVCTVTPGAMPIAYALSQNYPNPFNATTEMRYALPEKAHVTIKIFNLLGQQVVTLVDGDKGAGYHTARWNGLNNHGAEVASGIYFYRLQTDDFSATRKMVFLK